VKRGISDEETDPEPYSVYAITKLKAESDVLASGGTVFRMATIYGFSPQMRYDLIVNQFVKEALESGMITVFGGDQFRPFMEIKSAVNAYLACLDVPIRGQVLNLADESLSLLELAEILKKTTGCQVNLVPEIHDRRSYAIDVSKVQKLINIETLPLCKGIGNMVAQAKIILGN
jgi:nucleoside-diphosphate-sugar epimerase